MGAHTPNNDPTSIPVTTYNQRSGFLEAKNFTDGECDCLGDQELDSPRTILSNGIYDRECELLPNEHNQYLSHSEEEPVEETTTPTLMEGRITDNKPTSIPETPYNQQNNSLTPKKNTDLDNQYFYTQPTMLPNDNSSSSSPNNSPTSNLIDTSGEHLFIERSASASNTIRSPGMSSNQQNSSGRPTVDNKNLTCSVTCFNNKTTLNDPPPTSQFGPHHKNAGGVVGHLENKQNQSTDNRSPSLATRETASGSFSRSRGDRSKQKFVGSATPTRTTKNHSLPFPILTPMQPKVTLSQSSTRGRGQTSSPIQETAKPCTIMTVQQTMAVQQTNVLVINYPSSTKDPENYSSNSQQSNSQQQTSFNTLTTAVVSYREDNSSTDSNSFDNPTIPDERSNEKSPTNFTRSP